MIFLDFLVVGGPRSGVRGRGSGVGGPRSGGLVGPGVRAAGLEVRAQRAPRLLLNILFYLEEK